jgi:Zinc carboxypeptidase
VRKLFVGLVVGGLLALSLPVHAAPPPAQLQSLPEADQLQLYTAEVSDSIARRLAEQGIDIAATRKVAGGVQVDLVLSRLDLQRVERLGARPHLERDTKGLSALQRAAQQAQAGYQVWRPYSGPNGLAAKLRAVAQAYPEDTSLRSIGRSRRGQDILALEVTRDARRVRNGQRPAVLYVGLQHAREWIAGEVTMRLLAYVLSNDGKDPQVTKLVDSTQLWFVPVANPDGYNFTFTPGNRLWRKTLTDNDGDGRITGVDGVDPNRNFPTKWGYDEEGSSSNLKGDDYRGPAPASEPETRALDQFLKRVGFKFLVNYHSYGEQLLYPLGFQVQTQTADQPIYAALSGDDAKPAIPGFHPKLSAELYITNGELTDHAHSTYGTLAWTPELGEGCKGCGFVFPDDEVAVQAEFERNLPFALDVARSAADPANPVSHLGNTVPAFVLDPFAVSYGDPQTVQVDAKRALGEVRLRYRINGGRVAEAATREWKGGLRYGADGDVYYHRLRGQVRGASVGDQVEVWFEALGARRRVSDGTPALVRSASFTYRLASNSHHRALVVAAEDCGTRPTGRPCPLGARYAVDALTANRLPTDVYDIDTNARTAPHPLGVLSHYDVVVTTTGNDVVLRAAGQPKGTVAKVANDLELALREYLNEGGRLLYEGKYAGFASGADGAYLYNPTAPPECSARQAPCLPLSNDFLQYWLGAYRYNDDAGTRPGSGRPWPLVGAKGAFAGASYTLGGAGSVGNDDHTASFLTTSSVLDPGRFPQFASAAVLEWQRQGPSPFVPLTGDWYVWSGRDDRSWKRLSRVVDLRGASSGALRLQISYDVDAGFDFVFVEAHTVGQNDWTTLPVPGRTAEDTGKSCPGDWRMLHPFLDHYQTRSADGTCSPTGMTGQWHAATGDSGGWQPWDVDLSRYAGQKVEVVVTYASDEDGQGSGVFVDDARVLRDGVVVAQTSFESDLGGWTVAGPPEGSAPNTNDWARSRAAFHEGAGVVTRQTVYLGFGLEDISTARQRADLVHRALAHLRKG